MSLNDNEQKAIEDMRQRIEETNELERLKQEVARKKVLVDDRKYTALLERDKKHDKELEIAKKINFSQMSEEQIKKLQEENDAYMEAAKYQLLFIFDGFAGIVPFFRRNLILIAGKTGKGKSTAVTNIIYNIIRQTNPRTGKKCKVVHITNEENAGDAYNKLTCLAKGWNYVDHSSFTEEQKEVFRQAIPVWAERVTIIDNQFNGGRDITKSIEGIQSIFDDMIARQEFPDAITIDFYQFVTISKLNPYLQPRQVLEAFSEVLNTYKDILPCPIAIMSQIWPDSEETTDLENKIKGSKSILVPSTMAMEMITDSEALLTTCVVHKNRFNGATIGKEIKMGFDKGKFVKYDNNFIEKVQKMRYERESRAMDKAIGIKDAFEEKKDGN